MIFATIQKYVVQLQNLMKKKDVKINDIPMIIIDSNPDFKPPFMKQNQCINLFIILGYQVVIRIPVAKIVEEIIVGYFLLQQQQVHKF